MPGAITPVPVIQPSGLTPDHPMELETPISDDSHLTNEPSGSGPQESHHEIIDQLSN